MFLLLRLTLSAFDPNVMAHTITVNGYEYAWQHGFNDKNWNDYYAYVFFTKVDPGIHIKALQYRTCLTCVPGAETVAFEGTGPSIPRYHEFRDHLYKLVISGTGTVVFSEWEDHGNDCIEGIYTINHPNTTYFLNETTTNPPNAFPLLDAPKTFCILIASTKYTGWLTAYFNQDQGESMICSNGFNSDNPLTSGEQRFNFEAEQDNGEWSNLIIKVNITSAPGPKSLKIEFQSDLVVPPQDLYPPLPPATPSHIFSISQQFVASATFSESELFSASSQFSPSEDFSESNSFSPSSKFSSSSQFSPSSKFSASKSFTNSKSFTKSSEFTASDDFTASKKFISLTPTQSSNNIPTPSRLLNSKTPTATRKVNIITDDPNTTSTPTVDPQYNYKAIVQKRSPLTNGEIVTIATTTTLSIGMIIIVIICFILYLRNKAKQMKQTAELNCSDSCMNETDDTSYSYTYSYYYTCSEGFSSEKVELSENSEFYAPPTARVMSNHVIQMNLLNPNTV